MFAYVLDFAIALAFRLKPADGAGGSDELFVSPSFHCLMVAGTHKHTGKHCLLSLLLSLSLYSCHLRGFIANVCVYTTPVGGDRASGAC